MAFAGTAADLDLYRRSRAFYDQMVKAIEEQLLLLENYEQTIQSGALETMTWDERTDFMRDVSSCRRELKISQRFLAAWPEP